MFEQAIVDQLTAVFGQLSQDIQLDLATSSHAQQTELRDWLAAVAATSPRISLREQAETQPIPTFSISVAGKPSGMRFQGIPGGHEFTSLIVAILNASGLGKLPDAGIQQRIRALKAPAELVTYISLSCENCPDVVQALNQIALIHGGIRHTMIDGAMMTAELERRNIQGVPTVMLGETMLHTGRATLSELLEKLEKHLGTDAASAGPVDLGLFEVLVIGGGPAGIAAAVYAVRKGQKTGLITEKIGGQVQETKGIENLVGTVYTEGNILSANFDKHLRAYPAQIFEHRRVETVTTKDGIHHLTLSSGEKVSANHLIIATGAKWRELGVPGEKEYLGRGVAFCPHCEGPFYKDKKVAVIGGGNSGVEAAIDLSGICSEVTLLEFADALKADQVLINKVRTLANVKILTQAKTAEVFGDGNKVVAMSYEDRRDGKVQRFDVDGVFVQIGLSPNSAVVKGLVETNKYGEIVVDAHGRTSAPGIYAAGDVTTVPYKQIVIAIGEGSKVALTAFEDRMRSGK